MHQSCIYPVYENYNEPHRYYHNVNHVQSMLKEVDELRRDLDVHEIGILTRAIVYHDVIYDPRRQDNEERSVEFMRQHCSFMEMEDVARITQLIRATAPSTYDSDGNDMLVTLIRYLDCKTLYDEDLIQMMINFKLLLKEFQFVNYKTFRDNHLLFFNCFSFLLGMDSEVKEYYRKYVLSYRPKIGVYAGSFNPFHIGHMSVLEQAERVFDKVIVLYPEGESSLVPVEKILPFHEVIPFKGLLTDFMRKLGSDIDYTLIRGMRNGNDLEYEVNLNKAYKDLGSHTNVMYFMTDKPHVSSNMIREIAKVSDRYKMYVPDKFRYAGEL